MHELHDIPKGSTLGVNYTRLHDSAIAVVGPDGATRFACSLERLSRLKQDGRQPDELLQELPWDAIDQVAIASSTFEDATALGVEHRDRQWPWRRKSREWELTVARHPDGCEAFYAGLKKPQQRYDHHLSHAASAFFPSGFERALVLTCDAGAFQCPWHAAAYVAEGAEVRLLAGVHCNEYLSPSHLYTVVTALLGLRPNRHEGKVTGLSARGSVTEVEYERFLAGAWPMVENLGEMLRWENGDASFAPTLVVNAGVRDAWRHELRFLSDEQLAACVQRTAEEAALGLASRARELADGDYGDVCLAGGLFSNVRVNQRVLESGFARLFVAPPMTDDGVSLGAAQLAHLQRDPAALPGRHRTTMYLGPDVEQGEEDLLKGAGVIATRPDDLPQQVAKLLATGRVVAVARGRMEFGPRALGHRSVLAEAIDPGINDALNARLHRTEYMPFAPILLAADAPELIKGHEPVARAARFMTVTVDCTDAMCEEAPAAVHIDGTARPQLLEPGDDPFCEAVLAAYREQTGRRVLINTSFNVHEEPITCTTRDALRGFADTRLDALVVGDQLVAFDENVAALERFAAQPREVVPQPMPPDVGMGRWLGSVQSALDAEREKSRRIFEAKLWNEQQAKQAHERVAALEQQLEAERRRAADAESAVAGLHAHIRRNLAESQAAEGGPVRKRSDAVARTAAFDGKAGFDTRNPDYANTPVSARRYVCDFEPHDAAAAPFVSVITPFFNAGEVFEETARSVLQQSFQQFEWVIVDDGSTDAAALAMLARIADSDPRIRVVRQENRGLPGARNRGFAEARSDYVVKLDADDLIEPTALEKWLWLLISYPEYAVAKGMTIGFGSQQYVWRQGFHEPQRFLDANAVTVTGMVRRAVHEEIGGYDEDIRGGLEDWDYWLKCASHGHWGGSIPEALDWYRRRDDHSGDWGNWDGVGNFRDKLKERYPALWEHGIRPKRIAPPIAWETVSDVLPCNNLLAKSRPRVLLVLPWMTMGGADRFNLDLVQQLSERGYDVTIAATLHGDNSWAPLFERFTSDIFVLEHFVRDKDYPRFLHYLIQSRGCDQVLMSHSQYGYMVLPYLRHRCPGVAFVDYCHAEFEEWINGGYPRFSAGLRSYLDVTAVSSEHLKRWIVGRGGDADDIEVCYTSVDCDVWKPDAEARCRARAELGIDDGACVIAYPARLCDQKQPLVFGETIQRLRDSGRSFTALVIGDGPDRGQLQSFVQRHELQDVVRFLGAVPGPRMTSLMAASDVMFLPSKFEGIALSLFEAMATGAVVVGAVVGGQRELVVDGCGFLIERDLCTDEPAAYCEILGRLIDDPELRRQVAQRAMQRVREGFRLQNMGDRMVEILEQATARRASEVTPCLPSDSAAVECATAAVEYCRLERLAMDLWRSRDERLGLQKSWRTTAYRMAVRVHDRLPAPMQKLGVSLYRRLFARN